MSFLFAAYHASYFFVFSAVELVGGCIVHALIGQCLVYFAI